MDTNSTLNPLSGVYAVPTIRKVEQWPAKYLGLRFTLLILATWGIGLVVGFELSLQVLTVTGFVLAIAGLRWPNLGLLGISMLCTLDTVSRHLIMTSSGLWRYNTFNYWLLVVILLSLPLLLKLKGVQTRILQIFVLLLGLEIGVSAAWENGFQHLLNIVTMFGLLVYFTKASLDKYYWYWLGVINGTLGAAGGLVFYLQKSQLREINYNAWAYFPLTAIFCICLSFSFASDKRRRQMILGLLAIVNYFWVFISSSRGVLLVATVCIMFLLFTASGLSTRLIYAGLFIIATALISTVFASLEDRAVFRIEKLTDRDQSYVGRTSGRSELVLAGWYMFLDHPFGVGTGGFASARISEGYSERTSGWESDLPMEAHAGWMKTLAENGVPGILLQVAYVLSFAIFGWRRRHQGVFSLGLLVTLSLSLAFITTEAQTKGLWFLAAAVTALLSKNHQCVARKPIQRLRVTRRQLSGNSFPLRVKRHARGA